MKREVMERWVEALRSGEYTQTTGDLRNDEGFCCLGVLCDIASKDGIGEWTTNLGETVFKCEDRTAMTLPPGSIAAWSGMKDRSGLLPEEIADQSMLWELNDTAKYDFEQIADVIEKHWEEL